MKIEKRDGSRERKILTGMIVDSSVLGRISTKWTGQEFSNKWANTVAGWCVEFYKKYGDAPQKGVESLFEAWAEKTRDKDTTALVEKFLGSLSEEYKQAKEGINSAQIVDIAGEHFNQVKINKAIEETQSHLEAGQLEKAKKVFTSFSWIEMGVGAGVDLFLDREAVKSTLSKTRKDPLIEYSGALGQFFGDRLERDGFVAILAPDKTGKTGMLVDMAYRAMLQRRRVAFFEVGDESESQISERFIVRTARQPFRAPEEKWPYTVMYPTSLEAGEAPTYTATVEFEERKFLEPLNWKQAWKACENTMRAKVKSKESYFRLSVHPNMSIGMGGIKSILQSWELDNWIPDVVVIDYADNLTNMAGHEDARDGINANWKMMRALSQEKHCLVLTATQADADSYDRKILGRSNFSEDKRKNAHVTAMFAINQTAEEKDIGVMRFNWIVARRGGFSPRRCVTIASCLPLCNPCVKSVW